MTTHITTLSENTASGPSELLGEWGFSVLVETDAANILLDTGHGVSATYNADILGVNISRVDKMVLSHGHHDHTGGLREVLRRMKKDIEIIAHPDIWTAKYGRFQGQAAKYCGIPFQRSELENLGARFNLTRESLEIAENVLTTGEIPMVTEFEQAAANLFVKEDNKLKPDLVLDDQALIIKTEQGLVIILGCAHRGVINTVYHAQKLTGEKSIAMVLGGCHLIGSDEEQINKTIAALKELEVKRIGVSHCTGMAATVMMAREFGDSFFFNNAGTRIKLP